MPTTRVQDISPAGRVVARTFRKLSKIQRNLPLTARLKIWKKTGLQKFHQRSEHTVPSNKRSANAKGLTKKPKKLSSVNSSPSAKYRHLPARGAAGTPGHKNFGPGGIEKPVAEIPEVIGKNQTIIDQVALGTQQFSQDPPEEVSQITSSQPVAPEPPLPDEPAPKAVEPPTEPTEVEETVQSSPQPEEPAQFVAPGISQAVATLLATARPAPVRIAAAKLELEIAQATKMADPSCAEFVGVVVQRVKPKSSSDANWSLRGIKFGRSDRNAVDDVLTTIVERMQREFRLSDE